MIKFTVQGNPVPQGSMMAFTPRGWKRPIITSANPKLKKWRKLVHDEAAVAVGKGTPAGKNVALKITVRFFLDRAKSNKSIDAVKRPDLDKLLRGILDGMTGVIYEDDSQVVLIKAEKLYGTPRAEIQVEELGIVPVSIKRKPIWDRDIPF